MTDQTGEEPVTGIVSAISKVLFRRVIIPNVTLCSLGMAYKDAHGIVACLDETRHGLEDGDAVTFTEIKGMTELNGAPHRAIKVTGIPFCTCYCIT